MNMDYKSSRVMQENISSLGDYENDFRTKNLLKLVLGHIEGNKMLDIGSGGGQLLNTLNSLGKLAIGIEPDKSIFNMCKSRYPNLNVLNCKAEDIDKHKLSGFDCAIMIDSLEHIENDQKTIQNIFHLLKNYGKLIINVPCYEFLWGIKDRKHGHYRRYNKRSLKTLLTSNSFRIQSMRYWNMILLIPYIISEKIFKKELENKNRYNRNITTMLLNYWFKMVENKINLGFGLNIISVARKVVQ